MDGPKVCRVCLCANNMLYRIADKLNGEVYEKLTNSKVVCEGRPCRVCCACLSVLQRCRTFIETATRANAALDQWHRSRVRGAPLELTERPLFVFTTSPLEHFEISIDGQQPIVKQETDNQENHDEHIIYTTEQIKFEVTEDEDDVELYRSNVISNSDDEYKSQVSPDEVLETGIERKSIILEAGDDANSVNMSLEADIVVDETGGVCVSDQDTPAPGATSTERASSNKDSHNGPAAKRRRPAPARHRPTDTDSAFGGNIRDYKNIDKIIHTGVKPFQCDKCNYKSVTKNNFKRHLLTHTKRFACSKCDFKCGRTGILKRHIMIHTGEKPFACDKCDYKCLQKESLKIHIMTHTGEKPFACDRCDYKFVNKSKLKRHLMTHTGEKKFACDKCDYKSSRKEVLKIHLLNHTGVKLFGCDKCNYKCNTKEHLKVHFMIHTGEKPFACDKCDYKSAIVNNLKIHLMTHTGEKPYKCDKCNYKCSRKETLKRHSLTHTGEKPFACDRCPYKSNDKCKLKRHLLIHGEIPYACDKCDYKCKQKRLLKNHILAHTGEK